MVEVKKHRSSAARRLALATAIFVMTSAYSGSFAATEHWNDASTSADSSWKQWKTDWENIKDDYENVSLTPGSNASELNFAWYSHRTEVPKVRVSKTRNGLKNAKAFDGTQEETTVAYSAALQEENKDGTSYKSNKVTVTGLKENTTYYYQVYQNGKWQTAEKYRSGDTDEYSVIYVADPQIGASKGQTSSEDEVMADAKDGSSTLAARNDSYNWDVILQDAAEQHSDLSFMISAGDQVNYSNYEYEYAGFLNPSVLASLPVATTIGNHDSGARNYTWHFNNPNSIDVTQDSEGALTAGHTNAGSDYYFTYGDVLYIVIDTNNYNCATHENVIRKAVEENQNAKWRIVTFHQDIYGSGKDHSDSDGMVLRTQLTPIMDKYDIDVVLQGHDHTYSRTYQLTSDGKDHKVITDTKSEEFQSENLCYNLASTEADGDTVINPEGTVYFEQNSATGSKFYELIANQQDYIAERSQTWTPTYSIINVSDTELSVTTYDASTGDKLEGSAEYTIVKDTFDIAGAAVSGIKDKTYTGKAQTQNITVKLDGKTLTKGKDYTVTYKNNTRVGTATVVIKGIGNYKGTITKTFKIRLAAPSSVTVKAGKASVSVKWSKVTGAEGYKIYAATKSNGTYKLVKTVTSSKTLSASVKNLKKGTRYFKVRAYSKVNGKVVYGTFSSVKKVTIK
ncbi:MAG: metallophosphoesterase [Lentihominibacter sp.]|nr:metallophosphoesterase [Lentihominibacter sp.]